jgi:signal transduction histidine kinase/streptogramin lyase
LARFDGVRFVNFDRQNSGLDHNTVQALLVDRKGTLWAGTQGGGLNHFDGEKFFSFGASSGLPNHAIRALFEDKRGVLWIGTDGGGLVRMQEGKFKVFNKSMGLADDSVFSISGDENGNIWAGTHGGLSRLSAGRFTTFNAQNGLLSNFVRVVKSDRQGNVWVGTNSGLNRISSTGISHLTTENGLKSNDISSIAEDKAGTLWIGTDTGGLHRLVNGRITSYIDETSFLGKYIWSIYEDREGSLWIGTGGRGLTCLKQALFTTLTKKDGLSSNIILPVLEDAEGTLWIGSDQGLMKRENGQITVLTTKEGLPHNLVSSLAQGRDGAIWVGTRHGLARIKNGKITTFTAESGLPNDFILCIYIDRAGNVWTGTRAGLSRFDGRKFATYTTKDGLSNNFVLCIEEDGSGTLWIGTFGGGLDSFQHGQFHAYTTRNGLSSDVISAIYRDKDGVLWLATNNGGLNRFKQGKISTFSASVEMYKDSIFQVLEDSKGYLWLTSNKGVFRYSKRQLNDFAERRANTVHSAQYDTTEGMGSRECNGGFQPAGWKGKDGRLYIPTTGGLAFTDSGAATEDHSRLQVTLERVSIDDRNYPLSKPLVSPPGKGRLEFQFTAPSFIAPEKLRFRYMLEGFDKDWIQAGNQRIAYYTNIPHGEYRFHVQVRNSDGWKPEASTAAITLRPHFYQTTTFYMLVLVAVFGTCIAAYRVRMDQIIQREQKLKLLVDERTSALRESERQLRHSRDGLEIRVQERTQELTHANQALGEEVETRRRTEEQLILAKDAAEAANRAKSEFLANMSHEIRTPINGIVGMTDVALSTDLDDEQREYLELVKFSAGSLLGIVNDILDFSKIEARKLHLDRAAFQLKGSVDELLRSLKVRASQKNLTLTCHIADDVPNCVIGDPLRLRQVLLNLLDNAIKFTSQGGITLNLFLDQQSETTAYVHFTVRDTGIGISEDKQKTIFEAFSQADTSSTRRYGGTGLGLTISCQLAALMGGSLWVQSKPGDGSTFHFTAHLEIDPSIMDAGSENQSAKLVLA